MTLLTADLEICDNRVDIPFPVSNFQTYGQGTGPVGKVEDAQRSRQTVATRDKL